ncbi:hypothetical protein Tco_0898825 [Tanacetum coccineum]
MENVNPLKTTPNQAIIATGIPSSSPDRTCLVISIFLRDQASIGLTSSLQDPSPYGDLTTQSCNSFHLGKDRKTLQRYLDVPTKSWRISIRSMDSFQGLTPKSPSLWHRSLASNPNFL